MSKLIQVIVDGNREFIIVDTVKGIEHFTPEEALKLSDELIQAVSRLSNQTKINYFREHEKRNPAQTVPGSIPLGEK